MGIECHECDMARPPVGRCQVEGVDGPQRLLAAQLGGAIEAPLIDWNRVDPFPVVAQGSAHPVAVGGHDAHPIDQAKRFGPGQG